MRCIVTLPLPLRPTPVPRETVHSFLSRLAAMNRVGAADFSSDMGFSFKGILHLDETALGRLAEVGGVDDAQVKEMLSWTGQRAGDFRTVFRGESFVSRALRNPVMKGCPICLREDAADHHGEPLEAMVMRGHWLMREAATCVRHHHPLVLLWEARHPGKRLDVGARLSELLSDILGGALDATGREPTPYDLWLDARLEDGSDTTWLAGQSLDAATTVCRAFGSDLLRLNQEEDLSPREEPCAARALGFEVVRHGEDAIHRALDRLLVAESNEKAKPSGAFGTLYGLLSVDKRDDEQFDAFRDILREFILDTWPVATGQFVLGREVQERRLHSVGSAAQEAGMTPELVEQILVHSGALPEDDDRPALRRTFNAKLYAELLEVLPNLVGPRELRKAMGATRTQLDSLVEDGVLVPRIDMKTLKSPWLLTDGTNLVAELQGSAVKQEGPDSAWETIQNAQKRSGVRVGTIISAIRSGDLRVAKCAAPAGYGGLLVPKAEIDKMVVSTAALPGDAAMSAAVFGRKIGMRNNNRFSRLVEAGHTPGRWMRHPKTNVRSLYLSETDIAAFHARFFTLPTMAAEFGEHRQTLLAKLRAAGIKPYAPDGEDYGFLYLRKDVESVLR
ncbi:TniQ family protein [Halovulum sp. GXIMD14794]